jgi:prepilin-type N-terminal cleavage/methylation domain-containing protein
MKQNQNTNSGFTLVELLVVISIIGILSSFAVVSLNSARAKARDALRKGDMAQIRTALNLYYDDNLSYPICGTWNGDDEDFGAAVSAGSACYNGTLTTALSGGARPFLGEMPKDPKNTTNDPNVSNVYLYRYVSNSDGTMYALVYRIEDSTSLQYIRGW